MLQKYTVRETVLLLEDSGTVRRGKGGKMYGCAPGSRGECNAGSRVRPRREHELFLIGHDRNPATNNQRGQQILYSTITTAECMKHKTTPHNTDIVLM